MPYKVRCQSKMNIAEKFAELSIDPNRLTKKKQQTSKKIEYVSEYVWLWALVMLERNDIHTLNFVDCMCNAGVYHDGDCCTADFFFFSREISPQKFLYLVQ